MTWKNEDWKQRMPAFVLGAGLWTTAIALPTIFRGCATSSSAFVRSVGPAAIGIGVVMIVLLWICSAAGWESFRVGGGGGMQLKLIATVAVAATLVGMVAIAYWSGNCLLRWRDRLRGRAF